MGKAQLRNTELPTFFGTIQLKGERLDIDLSKEINTPSLFYKNPNGELWQGNSIEWLESLQSESVDLIFADPTIQH